VNDEPAVYLGLGSNLGNREANLRMALRLLDPLCRVEEVSSLYETAPVGVEDQPPFYNAACRVTTGLGPEALLRFLQGVEFEVGRRPGGPRWGPRPVDLDILLYGDRIVEWADLVLPHPRLAERPFVLVPLAEMAPDLRHPTLGETVRELLTAAGEQGVALVEPTGWHRKRLPSAGGGIVSGEGRSG
jgi:2-amino-4-hydroxy-6-hydroxymethyldihydropteridine diphosphokinase